MATESCPICRVVREKTLGGLCPRCMLQQVTLQDEAEGTSTEVLPLPALKAARVKRRWVGNYELLDEIAHGGMGVVFRARQASLNRIVALKMILSEWPSELEVRRFRTEAESAAHLDHPNIVAIHEVGEHEKQQFFSMQYVEGESLARLLEQKQWDLNDGRASARITAKIARAVHYAHQHGILHRDLKPGNVLVDKEGEPHVTDFGLAKALTHDANVTQSHAFIGTPSYMPPEQASEATRRLTTAADVYGLGAILYSLLTGQAPFRGSSAAETLHLVLEKEPARPSLKNPAVEKDLETICLKCLEKDPQRRYTSAAALAEDLERYLRREPIHAKPCTYTDQVVKWCRRKPLIATLTASLFVVAALGVLGLVWQWQQAKANEARAVKNEQRVLGALALSNFSQAQARRVSGAAGQRTESLKALTNALPYFTNKAMLRDEMIAALALPDLAEYRHVNYPSGQTQAFEINLQARVVAEAEADGTIHIRDLEGGTRLKSLPGLGAPVEKLRFAPGEPVLVAEYSNAPQRQVTVWNWQQERKLFEATNGIHADAIDFIPDGKTLVIGQSDGRVIVYAIPGGEILDDRVLRLASGTARVPHVIRFDPSGELFAECCPDDLYVQVWRLGTVEPVAKLAHADVVHSLAWDPNGRLLATACRDSYLYLWKSNFINRPGKPGGREGPAMAASDSGETEQQVPWKLGGHEGPVTAVAFNACGTLLASLGLDETVQLWTPATGHHLTWRLQGETYERLQFGSSGPLLLATDLRQRKSRVWETVGDDYVAVRHRGSPKYKLSTIDFSPDGHWLAATSGDQAVIWDANWCRECMILPLNNAQAAFFSSDSQRILVCTTGELFSQPVAHPGERQQHNEWWLMLGSMALTPDRSLAAIAHMDKILLVSIKAGSETATRSVSVPGFYPYLSLHSEGRWVAGMTEGSNVVQVLDISEGTEARVVSTLRGSKYFGFSPDGRWLVVCWEGKYEFYGVGAWERPLFVINRKATTDQHAPFAFTSDGAVVALASSRYAIQLYRLPRNGAGQPVLMANLESPDRFPLEILTFSQNGRHLAAATKDQTIQVWNLELLGQHLSELQMHTDWLTFSTNSAMTPQK